MQLRGRMQTPEQACPLPATCPPLAFRSPARLAEGVKASGSKAARSTRSGTLSSTSRIRTCKQESAGQGLPQQRHSRWQPGHEPACSAGQKSAARRRVKGGVEQVGRFCRRSCNALAASQRQATCWSRLANKANTAHRSISFGHAVQLSLGLHLGPTNDLGQGTRPRDAYHRR